MNAFLVNRFVFPLHERLKGAANVRQLRELERTQWLAPDALRELQFERLRRHLQHAYDNTVYYRRLFDEHGIEPRRVASPEDVRRIPPLTRERLRKHFDELVARGVREGGPVQRVATGGSTGEPVTVLIDQRIGSSAAIRYRAHRWFGLEPFAREIVLWGSPLELKQQDRVRAFRDWLINSRLLSAFDLGEEALARYRAVLERHRPERIFGYASAIHLFARYLQGQGWRPTWRLKAVFTTAEPLFDFQREVIQQVFGCRAAVEYGARDAGMVANECPQGGLHIPAETAYVETDGRAADGLGEVLVTDFTLTAMPLIRYRTGDLGELDDGTCACGRSLPLLKRVEGRRTDFLLAPDGRVLHALSVIYILREAEGVQQFQVVQEAVDRVVVQIVPGPRFGEGERAVIVERMRRLLGRGTDVRIQTVGSIARAASGKFRYVISRVADAHLETMFADRPEALVGQGVEA